MITHERIKNLPQTQFLTLSLRTERTFSRYVAFYKRLSAAGKTRSSD
jgi:hypothetical protein